jgi:hypothetical protein
MEIIELNNKDLKTSDIESAAVIFIESQVKEMSLLEFGEKCIRTKDENDNFIIEPWQSDSVFSKQIAEMDFWIRTNIKEYLETNTNVKRNNVKTVFCFWDEWNNTFHTLELRNGEFYGIFWCTTT